MVSTDFGKLEVRRHLISGIDWATGGRATAVAAAPSPAALRNSRRFMEGVPSVMLDRATGARPAPGADRRFVASDGLVPRIGDAQDETAGRRGQLAKSSNARGKAKGSGLE